MKNLFKPCAVCFLTLPLIASAAYGAEEPIAFNKLGQLITYPGKKEVQRPKLTEKSMVIFAIGQSNSANHGGQKFQNSNVHILNYYGGRFFVASDPLLGATGSSGSPWLLAAQKILSQGQHDKIVISSAGVGGTSVARWKKDGDLYQMLSERHEDLKKNNLTVTHFLWHQGESDNPQVDPKALGPEDYKNGMIDVIQLTKKYFPRSKFFVAIATVCNYPLQPAEKIQVSQRQLADLPGVFQGPNTDLIGLEDRYDNCHFSASGLEKHANGWVTSVQKAR